MSPTTSPTVNVIFMTSTLPVAKDECEATRPVEAEHEGDRYTDTFSVMTRSVIVYFGGETQFRTQDLSPPEVVARRLLRDLSRSREAKKYAATDA